VTVLSSIAETGCVTRRFGVTNDGHHHHDEWHQRFGSKARAPASELRELLTESLETAAASGRKSINARERAMSCELAVLDDRIKHQRSELVRADIPWFGGGQPQVRPPHGHRCAVGTVDRHPCISPRKNFANYNRRIAR
jgi:hypothetical protein